ncbi:MAG: hypothetical protein QNJ20_05695 [Paracoccaceae bacterium]|nr:hypothetical protein [Paracoccaceae bacterium]
MERLFASTELYALEDNALAIENAIETLKGRLQGAPLGVASDVLKRCDPETHAELIDWLSDRCDGARWRRLPKAWSPKRDLSTWMLYQAADLTCPESPPF